MADGTVNIEIERTAQPQTVHVSHASPVFTYPVSDDDRDPFWQAPHTRYREWERIATYPDYLSAHIVAGLLENEGVPAVVEPAATFPDAMASRMWVPIELAHRARWILSLPAPSDAELTFLATGELDVDA